MAKHATGNTTLISPGIIPFGSIDESVLMQCDLKSSANVIAAGGTETGSPTYSDKGFTNTDNANYIRFDTITGYEKLDYAGQISMECEIELLGSKDGGDQTWANDHFLTNTDNTNTTSVPYGRWFRRATSLQLQVEQNTGDTPEKITHISVLDTKPTAILTISWIGNNMSMYMDGRLLFDNQVRSFGITVDNWKYFYLGSNRGETASITSMKGYSIKNIVVSSRPVMIPKHPVLSTVAIISHSFCSGVAPYPIIPTVVGYGWDKDIPRSIAGYLAQKGISCRPAIYAESGAALDDVYGGANLDAEFAAAVATRPTVAIILAGTNDVTIGADGTSFSPITFESKYKGFIDDLAATCQYIVCCTITTTAAKTQFGPGTPAYTNVDTANAIIKALPEYNPKCIVADNFAATNGNTLGSIYWEGERIGGYDNLHPTAKGCRVIGEDIGKAIYDALT